MLPLGDREPPLAFARAVAPTPISRPYETFLRHARRLSAIAAIAAIRGVEVIPEAEHRVLEESSERLLDAKAQLDDLTSPHDGTEYVLALRAILTNVSAAIADDFSTIEDLVNEGKSGWNEIEHLLSLSLLDPDRAGEPGTDAAIVFNTAVLISAVEDDFDGADGRIAHMLAPFA